MSDSEFTVTDHGDTIPTPTRSGLERIDLISAFASPPAPLDFAWPGFLAGTVGILSSPGGSGKSMWALEALCAVAGGLGADPLELNPAANGRAVYLCLEDPREVLLHRLFALGQRFDEAARARVVENLEVYPAVGHALDLLDRRHRDGLVRALSGVRVAVIDTLSRAHRGDENSNGQMAQALGGLEWICSRTGAAILLLHHSRKGGAGDGGEAQHSARGASALVDNARWGAVLTRMTEAEAETLSDPDASADPLLPCRIRDRRGWYVRMSFPKPNYGEPLEDLWYRRARGGVLVPVKLEGMPARASAAERRAPGPGKVAGWR